MSRVVPALLSAIVVGVVVSTRNKTPNTPETKPPTTTPPDTTAPDVTMTAPLRPPPRPGIILTAPVVTSPPPDPPKPGTACAIRTGGGCFVLPDYVIDPAKPVRANTENIQANAFRVPFGGQVEILSGPVRIDVVPAGKAEVFYYTPKPTGALTLYRIRFCQPGTTTCRVGWISESSLR